MMMPIVHILLLCRIFYWTVKHRLLLLCAAVIKPGVCPAADHRQLSAGGCTQLCRLDLDCDGSAKCCDSADCAGKVCIELEEFGQLILPCFIALCHLVWFPLMQLCLCKSLHDSHCWLLLML